MSGEVTLVEFAQGLLSIPHPVIPSRVLKEPWHVGRILSEDDYTPVEVKDTDCERGSIIRRLSPLVPSNSSGNSLGVRGHGPSLEQQALRLELAQVQTELNSQRIISSQQQELMAELDFVKAALAETKHMDSRKDSDGMELAASLLEPEFMHEEQAPNSELSAAQAELAELQQNSTEHSALRDQLSYVFAELVAVKSQDNKSQTQMPNAEQNNKSE